MDKQFTHKTMIRAFLTPNMLFLNDFEPVTKGYNICGSKKIK